jgi:rhodanese-related sulfurtransferase
VRAKEAYDLWQADPEGVKILDLRTPEEWVFTGHAPMATPIPLAFLAYVWDDEKQAFPWSPNPDFVERVTERISPTTRSWSRAAPVAAGRWRSTC